MKNIQKVASILRNKDNFLLCGHSRPDGDCIGSQMGLYLLLKNMGKKVTLLNYGPILEHYSFVPEIGEMNSSIPDGTKIDYTICVDCGDLERVSEDFQPVGYVINIDHHLTNERYGDLNYIDKTAAAVGELIYNIAKELNEKITPDIATCIYLSIMADTGSFKYSNTSPKTFRISAELQEAGADIGSVAQEYYENISKKSLKVIAYTFDNLNFMYDDMVCWVEFPKDIYNDFELEMEEPEDLINMLRSIKGVEVAIIFREKTDNDVRIGFRSKGKINVSQLAGNIGGGGHSRAAGVTIHAPLDQSREIVFNELAKFMLELIPSK